jgi:hypothetical protein
MQVNSAAFRIGKAHDRILRAWGDWCGAAIQTDGNSAFVLYARRHEHYSREGVFARLIRKANMWSALAARDKCTKSF